MLYILGVLILLPTASYFVLRSPGVQTYLARKAAAYYSRMLNTEISIGGVNINFSLDIILEDIMIKDQHKNILLSVKKLQLDVKKIKPKDHILKFDKFILDDALINLTKYKEDTVINFQFIVDNLSTSDTITVKDTVPWYIKVSDFRIIDSRFIYHDQHKEALADQIDYDNIDISGLNIRINDLIMQGDTVIAKIRQIKLIEHSGFVLDDFSSDFKMSSAGMHVKDLCIITGNSNLSLDLIFDYQDFSYFDDFLHKIKINSEINESVLNISDLGYFAPELKGMNNDMKFAGTVRGSVDNFRVKEFRFDFGQSSHFFGDISMNGLPDIKETYINAKIKEFVTNIDDIRSVNIPDEDGNASRLEIEQSFEKFGEVNIMGSFTGFYNDFVANAKINSSLGNVTTDMVINRGRKEEIIKYYGKIMADQFDFGKLTGLQEYFGKFNLIADISGSGFNKENVAIQMNGTIDSLDFNSNNYNSISIEGSYADKTFNGLLNIRDELVYLDFLGKIDFSKTKPVFDFTSVIKNADLNRLKLVASDEKMILSTRLNINFTGLSIDSIMGSILADSTVFIQDNKKYQMEHLSLDVFDDLTGKKKIDLTSDFFDVNLEGEFQLADIAVSFDKFLDEYLSSVDLVSDSIKNSYGDNQVISVKIFLKNTYPLTDIFIPKLKVSPNSSISGTFNSVKGNFDFTGSTDELIYSGYEFKNFFIKGMSGKKSILLRTGCERLSFSDSLGIDDFSLNAKIYNDSIDYNLLWKNNDTVRNTADIAGFINFNNYPRIESRFTRFETYINDSLWNVNGDNYIIMDSTYVEVGTLDFSSENQFVKINGIISEDPGHKLDLEFRNFDISNFDLLLQNDDFDIDGYLNGKATLTDIYNSPNFVSDLHIQDLRLNNDKLGDAQIKSVWNDLEQSLYLKTEVIYKGNFGENVTLLIDGYYYPNDEERNFDLDIAVNNFKIKTISGMLSGFSSDIGGLATGSIKLQGTKNEPDITGSIRLLRTYMKVDYLNTKYSFTDEIAINSDNFGFNNLTLYDSLGNTAVVNGKISHKNFKDFVLDLNIKTQNLSCLNTTFAQNDEFYGNVFFTGDVSVKGAIDDISMKIDGKTEKKTKFTIPLSSTSEVSNSNYITFIDPGDTLIKEPEQESHSSNLSLNLNLTITSDAGIEIIMPAQSGNIKATGDGYIRLGISPDGDFNIYGDYVISKGSYLFTLQNVINKHFNIKNGGKIKWNGNPLDADIDLRAVYSIRAPLSGLMLASDSSGAYSQRIPVDCILDLQGKLFNPDIKFSIELPGSDHETQQLVYSQIDTNNQSQMSEQMIFLLVLNQFKPVSGNEVAMYSGVGTTSFDILTNQLNNWLSQISDDFDIGLNYRPGNDITSEEIEVALSTQLFNDRVSIDGDFGVAGADNTNKTSNIVGDVNVEVKITEDGRFRVKAFNKTNNVNSLEYNAPYTQGVGIFYRKEFDNLGDLFRRKKK